MNTLFEKLRSLVALMWREVAKFGVVGGVAFVIDVGLTFVLVHTIMDGSDAWARVVGASVATVFAWVANRLWTFRHRRAENKWSEFVKFLVINLFGMGIAAGFTWVAKYGFHVGNKNVLWMWGNVGIIVATVLRFFAYRFWVFNKELDAEPGFDHDHEIFEHEPASHSPAAR